MKNADMPVMPIELNGFGQYEPVSFTGMTKREYIASNIISGVLSNPYVIAYRSENTSQLAKRAIELADALLEELSK